MTDARADQYACTESLLNITPDAAVVSNLGVASYVLASVSDPERARNFYQWGSMGVTTAVGLGLALSTDEPVTVLDGDGSLLMSLGVLSTVARYDPDNLTIVVWANDVYGTTGGQSLQASHTDFAGIAENSGLDAITVGRPTRSRTPTGAPPSPRASPSLSATSTPSIPTHGQHLTSRTSPGVPAIHSRPIHE